LFYGAMAIAAVLWRVGFNGEDLFYASPGHQTLRELHPIRDVGLGLLLGGGVLGLSQLMTARTRWGEELARSLARGLSRLTVAEALLLALASGMAEEMFFRGALQPRVGWMAASLLFGALHFVPRREFLPWTGFAVVVGLLLGAAFDYTGNLVAPVVAHVLINGVNLPLLIRRYGPERGPTHDWDA
jgi:membrane protease YdiL (CAAX protease family)